MDMDPLQKRSLQPYLLRKISHTIIYYIFSWMEKQFSRATLFLTQYLCIVSHSLHNYSTIYRSIFIFTHIYIYIHLFISSINFTINKFDPFILLSLNVSYELSPKRLVFFLWVLLHILLYLELYFAKSMYHCPSSSMLGRSCKD
jgi:hypothetical protein